MEWIADPTVWAGLFSLILLELVLGIDNLVFIAVLAQRLPAEQRHRARQIGLALALVMRVALLSSLSWMMRLTTPLFDIAGHALSGRDLILLGGGAFLLVKATTEIHHRLEGVRYRSAGKLNAAFWMVVSQIVILDAIFSLDAVITAVGMVDHLSVMIIAVTVSIGIMIALSRPITEFVMKHPTLVMLCLGFLLMVSFSLIAEGMGVDIPKGYLYGAIGFSLMIETINQIAFAKMKKRVKGDENVRQKTADAILKLLGAKQGDGDEMQEANAVLQEAAKGSILTPVEKELLRGVLNISERPVHTIMTPRMDVQFLDIRKPRAEIADTVYNFARSHILVVDQELDNVLGILQRDDYLVSLLKNSEHILSPRDLHEPVFVQKRTSVMALLEMFRRQPIEMAVVLDEFGMVEGVVTHLDLLESIAGEFPDRDEETTPSFAIENNGDLLVDGLASIYDLCNRLGVDYTPDGRFGTVAGLVLHELGRFPAQGDSMEWCGWTLTVEGMDGRRISQIRFTKTV